MAQDFRGQTKGNSARRLEQVRHLLRSVGVHLDGNVRVAFFIEIAPGKFRRNPILRGIDVTKEQLCTLRVPADIPAKIPSSGLPPETLLYLVDMGLKQGDAL
jgi:hypothetical protein